MPRAYYNEIDPFASEWLRVLITCGLIAEGDVDSRSIEDVTSSDVAGYTQCHFFAGIGGWSRALRLSGWPDSRPVWTLSCPCQPFSAAGKGKGFADERHLWPAAHWLISQRRPITIFGEQVASPAGLNWFDTVSTDLERTAYSTRAIDLCAASIGAPHIRQRLYFRADSQIGRFPMLGESPGNTRYASQCNEPIELPNSNGRQSSNGDLQRSGEYGLLTENCGISDGGDAAQLRDGTFEWQPGSSDGPKIPPGGSSSFSVSGSVNSNATGLQKQLFLERLSRETMESLAWETFIGTGYTRGFWSGADWWHGRDEKYRPIEPGLFPLAYGISGRVGKLRGYGNAIVPPLAAEFIKATEGE